MPQFKKMRQTHYCINTFGHEKTNIKQMQIHGSLKTVLYIIISSISNHHKEVLIRRRFWNIFVEITCVQQKVLLLRFAH